MKHLRITAKLIGASLVVVGAWTSAASAAGSSAGHETAGGGDSEPVAAAEIVEMAEPIRPRAIVVIGGAIGQRATAFWALGRYEALGLEVPPIEIHLHQDLAECKGNRGIYNAGLQRIDVCVDEPCVMLHEIAHAWNHENLNDAQRSEYVSTGDFGSWDDPETPWFDRGSEDAADTIAWALLAEPITMASPDGPIAQRSSAFTFLTGLAASRVQMDPAD